jgi:hypothetical protein
MKLNQKEKEYYIEKIKEATSIVIQSDWRKYTGNERNLGIAVIAVFDKITSPLVNLRAESKRINRMKSYINLAKKKILK